MKIEHVAMYVNDLDTAKEFFVSLLGGVSNQGFLQVLVTLLFHYKMIRYSYILWIEAATMLIQNK